MTKTTISSLSSTVLTLSTDDLLSLTTSGELLAAGPEIVWKQTTAQSAGGVTVANSGIIESTSGRTIDTSGTAKGKDSFTLINNAGGSIIAATDVMRDQAGNDGGSIVISNAGLIEAGTASTAGNVSGRGFNFQEYATVGSVTGFATLSVSNAITGTIEAADDVFRVTTGAANSADSTLNPIFTGLITIANLGTIESVGAAGGAGSGQAIDFNDVNNQSAGGVIITNGTTLDSTALIMATDNDAIRPGNNGTVVNYGTIDGAEVFTASERSNPGVQAGDNGIAASTNETITVVNQAGGLIEGSKSGVFGSRTTLSATPTASSDIIVTNSGTIIGEDGKGVGADFGTIVNSGTIIGEDNTALLRGDGDGIDINDTASIVNTGLISAAGAEGVDDNGRPNISDGLALGGGVVTNSGTIVSVGNGVTVNNDSNTDGSRSGNVDLVLTNTGLIEAKGGYAIRSENKAGTNETGPISAVDYDTVANYGTIIAEGTIPNENGTFDVVSYGTTSSSSGVVTYGTTYTPDPNVVGTIEGQSYSSAADAGSVRFTEGDGSAIQLGEGNDILVNYGTIDATDGKAINLEGGNNTLDLYAGESITGTIDGGIGGTNILNLYIPAGAGLTPNATADTLSSVIDFATLNVNGGTWTVEDAETFSSISVADGTDLAIAASASLTGVFTLGNTGTIDLEGLTFSGSDGAALIGINGMLDVTEDGRTVTLTFDKSMAGDPVFFSRDDGTGTALTLCFLAGTAIATPAGERPVEELRIGDHVITRFGAIQPVKWIGRQSFAAPFVKNNHDKLPVQIKPGALGRNQPRRDLFVSPGHSMLVGDTLILARSLVNGITVMQDHLPDVVDYYQIEFEAHDCVLAEGAWSESFADGPGLRAQFHNVAEFARLYPGHPPAETLNLCAPRPESGPALAAALQPLVAAATALVEVGPMRGWIDLAGVDGTLAGWAQDIANPHLPVLLEVLVDQQVIGTVMACDYRDDLLSAGIGQGRCSFSFELSMALPVERLATLQVRRAADGTALRFSDACLHELKPAA